MVVDVFVSGSESGGEITIDLGGIRGDKGGNANPVNCCSASSADKVLRLPDEGIARGVGGVGGGEVRRW